MKKIIELADKYFETNNIMDGVRLKNAVIKYRRLSETPITEDWLKEHGFKDEYRGTWSKILRHWKDCDNFSHTIGVSVSSQNINNTMEGELNLIVNADSKGYLSKSIYSLADLYDALELCGIKID